MAVSTYTNGAMFSDLAIMHLCICTIQNTCKRKLVEINDKYAVVCKQSVKAPLVAFEFYLPIFFQLQVCEGPLALSQLNVWLSVSTVWGCFFCGKLYWQFELLTRIAVFAIRDSISVWYFALCFLWDVIVCMKVSIWTDM